jgi:hypothetical protein
MSCNYYHRKSYNNSNLIHQDSKLDSLNIEAGGWLKHAHMTTFSNKLTSYYQICTFKNTNKKFNIKRYQYYDPENIISVTNFEVNHLTINKIAKQLSKKSYKLYNTYDFDDVPEPNISELLKAQSDFI